MSFLGYLGNRVGAIILFLFALGSLFAFFMSPIATVNATGQTIYTPNYIYLGLAALTGIGGFYLNRTSSRHTA